MVSMPVRHCQVLFYAAEAGHVEVRDIRKRMAAEKDSTLLFARFPPACLANKDPRHRADRMRKKKTSLNPKQLLSD